MVNAPQNNMLSPVGLAFGVIALLGWTAYVLVARHGALIGYSPLDLAVARMAPAGLVFLPLLIRRGIGDLGGVGWRRGIILALFGGPAFGFLMAGGFTFAPVSHAVVLGAATLTLVTTLLAVRVVGEKLSPGRTLGLILIVTGIILVGSAAFQSQFSARILLGDALLIAANACFAVFTILVRVWQIPPLTGAAVVTVLSAMVMLPVYGVFADMPRLEALGWQAFALQWLGQGVFAGCVATYAYMSAVAHLGPTRGAVFPSAVPVAGMALGGPLLGEYPTMIQVVGAIVATIGLAAALGLIGQGLNRWGKN